MDAIIDRYSPEHADLTPEKIGVHKYIVGSVGGKEVWTLSSSYGLPSALCETQLLKTRRSLEALGAWRILAQIEKARTSQYQRESLM